MVMVVLYGVKREKKVYGKMTHKVEVGYAVNLYITRERERKETNWEKVKWILSD